jgi:hypothetical protein
MPIEIRELVIKAVIDNSAQQPETRQPQSGDGQSQRVLVEEIVTQVLQALEQNKNER